MKKKLRIACSFMIVYLVLVLCMSLVEQNAEGPIRSFTDALWYSVVTMTTVGYGDLYPVTAAGKILGSVFLLLSLGFLALVVNIVWSCITDEWIPGLMLWIHRKRAWYVFAESNEASDALSADIRRTDENAIVVHCKADHRRSGLTVSTALDAAALAQKAGFRGGERKLFLFSADEGKNRTDAADLTALGYTICCRSRETCQLSSVSFFDEYRDCARAYWRDHPLKDEDTVVLIGDSRYAAGLLDQSILVNCRLPWHRICYHVYGITQTYRQMHPELDKVLSINEASETRDALFFHDEPWDSGIFAPETRIILCHDQKEKNTELALMMRQWFGSAAQLHVLSDDRTLPATVFGTTDEVFTCELVMKHALDASAKAMHEIYRNATADTVPAWDALDGFLKDSNRAVADHAVTKHTLAREHGFTWPCGDASVIDRCRRSEHERWLRFYCLHNWTYAPKRDNPGRKHPCIVPYDDLSTADQAKDDYAWQQALDQRDPSA